MKYRTVAVEHEMIDAYLEKHRSHKEVVCINSHTLLFSKSFSHFPSLIRFIQRSNLMSLYSLPHTSNNLFKYSHCSMHATFDYRYEKDKSRISSPEMQTKFFHDL